MLDYLNQNPKKVALLGPDDNDLAKTVGAIASLPRYKILQVPLLQCVNCSNSILQSFDYISAFIGKIY